MTQFRQDETPKPQSFARMLAAKRFLARSVLLAEELLPRMLVPASLVLLFLSPAGSASFGPRRSGCMPPFFFSSS